MRKGRLRNTGKGFDNELKRYNLIDRVQAVKHTNEFGEI